MKVRSLVVSFVLFTVALLFLVTVHPVFSQDEGARILVRDADNISTNLVEFKRVEYVGQCPGRVLFPSSANGRFISAVPTAPNRRVIIRNVTEGVDDNPYPYTDREYSRGKYSETFDMTVDYTHQQQTFSFLKGANKLEYDVQDDQRSVATGAFIVNVTVREGGTFSRNQVCENFVRCSDRSDFRRRCYPVTECKCP